MYSKQLVSDKSNGNGFEVSYNRTFSLRLFFSPPPRLLGKQDTPAFI